MCTLQRLQASSLPKAELNLMRTSKQSFAN
jgi:hypothetical protein